ncbi:hypothetical protein D3C72_1654390 [compost metagenome]
MSSMQTVDVVISQKQGSTTVFVCSAPRPNFKVEVIARNRFEAMQSPSLLVAFEKAMQESARVRVL